MNSGLQNCLSDTSVKNGTKLESLKGRAIFKIEYCRICYPKVTCFVFKLYILQFKARVELDVPCLLLLMRHC